MTKEVAEKIARGITDKIECNTVDIDDWAEFWGFTREEYEEFLDMAIKALESQMWIPVNERLPEKNGKYLVTVRNGNVYAGVYDAFSGRFQCAATAWMPLPEPYRGESE